MNAEEFAIRAHDEVVESYAVLIRELLETTRQEDATDPYWRDLIRFYAGLEPSQRQLLIEVMKHSAVDAVSSILLLLNEDGEPVDLSGFQDSFLIADEERNRPS